VHPDQRGCVVDRRQVPERDVAEQVGADHREH
jgi:hypothetical protein